MCHDLISPPATAAAVGVAARTMERKALVVQGMQRIPPLLVAELLHREVEQREEVRLLELLRAHQDPLPLLPLPADQDRHVPSRRPLLPPPRHRHGRSLSLSLFVQSSPLLRMRSCCP